MKASELRIGNYYTGASRGGYEIATGRMIAQLEEGKLNALPVPLTPELLEKCGFTLFEQERYFVGKKHPLMPSIFLDKTNELSFFYQGERKIAIQSLHQLQNLYFALTGSELEINFQTLS